MSEPYFAVITTETATHYTPGDERSRTHPGHGYPESYETITITDVIKFKSQSELESWILKNDGRTKFEAVHITPIKYEKTVKLEIKPNRQGSGFSSHNI
jgi:hypothetical protein